MQCSKCGFKFERKEGAKFCPKCGEVIEEDSKGNNKNFFAIIAEKK